MIRSRRFALIAAVPALAVLALSACGDGSDSFSLGQGSPAVIHIGAGSVRDSQIAGAPSSESTLVGDAKMWAPWANYTYSFSGDASGLPSTGAAWSFAAGGSPDAARAARIAASLGLTGELQPMPAEYGGGWVIGSTDYTGPSLMIGADGLLSWWYNNPLAGVRSDIAVGCIEPGMAVTPDTAVGSDRSTSSGGAGSSAPTEPVSTSPVTTVVVGDTPPVSEPCEYDEPTAPVNVPDKATAEDMFRALLAEWGYDAGSIALETYADEWGAYVSGYLSLGGFRSPAYVSAGFGENGVISWASGTLATATPAGDYPLVSVDEAIARLNDRTGKWGWFGGWMAYSKGGVAMETSVATDAGAAVEGPGVAMPIVACPPNADCVTDTMPVPEEIAVVFTGVSMELTTVWAEDGTVFVLPAYTFTAADGMTATMVAVGEEYLDLPEITTTDTMPVTTVTGDTGVVSTDVATPETNLVHPTPMTLPADEVSAMVIGLNVEEATKVVSEFGWTVRVSTLDGGAQALDADYIETRVNVAVEVGIIVGVDFIG